MASYDETMAYKSVIIGEAGADLTGVGGLRGQPKRCEIYLNMPCLPASALAPISAGERGDSDDDVSSIPSQPMLSIDIETFGVDDFMDALSIVKAQVAVVAVSNGSDVFIWDDPINGVRPPLDDFDGIWVAHNGILFDYPILLRSGFNLNGTMQDTLANERLLRGGSVGIGGSLAKTMTRHLGFSPKGKIDHHVWRQPPPYPEDALVYSAADALYLLDVFLMQQAALGRYVFMDKE